MKKNKLTIYHIAKSVSYELLIEELLQAKGELVTRVLEKFKKRKYSIRSKVISLKIFNAFLFGILPIFPLLAYFEVIQLYSNTPLIEIKIFIQSIIFVIFFSLQFFDFFLMGIFNSLNIISGEIFSWLKTLPIPKKKISRIAIFTIFRAFDLPILMITTVFPIVMLIGTQNIMIFIICCGISLLNMTFTFFMLIIFGEKFVRLMNKHKFKLKNSLGLQLLNSFSYTIIIFGSIFIIQITLSSIITVINTILSYEFTTLLNLIFSLIPFPFNSSYLISISIDHNQINPFLWANCFLGLGLFILLIIAMFRKAISTFEKMGTEKIKKINLDNKTKKSQVKVKTSSPVKAFLHKDLLIASRSLQTFMAIIVPVIISFVFIFYFNTSYSGGGVLLSGDMFFNWIVFIGFSPITSSLIISNMLNIDLSGETIISTLPIIPRDHAKAKLILFLTIQTISTLSPCLMYVLHPNFMNLFISLVGVLPYAYFFLLLIFLMKVKLFSRIRNHYVVEDISPENRFMKWLKILILIYSIYFLLITFAYSFYYIQGVGSFLYIITMIMIFSFLALIRFFNSLFPKSRE